MILMVLMNDDADDDDCEKTRSCVSDARSVAVAGSFPLAAGFIMRLL